MTDPLRVSVYPCAVRVICRWRRAQVVDQRRNQGSGGGDPDRQRYASNAPTYPAPPPGPPRDLGQPVGNDMARYRGDQVVEGLMQHVRHGASTGYDRSNVSASSGARTRSRSSAWRVWDFTVLIEQLRMSAVSASERSS